MRSSVIHPSLAVMRSSNPAVTVMYRGSYQRLMMRTAPLTCLHTSFVKLLR